MAGYYITRHVVQPGVGLVAEAIAHRKAKKSQQQGLEDTVTSSAIVSDGAGHSGFDTVTTTPSKTSYQEEVMVPNTGSEIEDSPPAYNELVYQDEKDDRGESEKQFAEMTSKLEEVQLTKTTSKLSIPTGNALGPASISTIVNAYIAEYSPVAMARFLKSTVVLPQKRPGDPSRGFMHAYAPVLQDVGISQVAWLDFLACFEESLKISSAFDVFNLAIGVMSLIGHVVPNPFTTTATIALTVAEETAKAVYQRIRTNSFFAEINEKFFMPLGLYCLIMTYDPYSRAASQPFDISGQVSKAHNSEKTVRAYLKRNLGGVSATTHGEADMPDTAPLVYPDEGASQDTDGKQPNRFTRTRRFVDEYLDKRAHSRFAADNPTSVIAHEPEFESSLGSFGTRHQHSRGRGGPLGAALSMAVEEVTGGIYKGRAANPFVMVTRALRAKALYLMVTKLPTAEEQKAVREWVDLRSMSEEEAEEYERWDERGEEEARA